MFEGPEKKFQRHIAEYFIREHGYGVLEQDDITDKDWYFAEAHLLAFLRPRRRKPWYGSPRTTAATPLAESARPCATS